MCHQTLQNFIFKTLLGLALLGTTILTAQVPDIDMNTLRRLSEQEQQAYVSAAKERGYTLPQLEALARTRGASFDDLVLLRNAWNGANLVVAQPTDFSATQTDTMTDFGQRSYIQADAQPDEQIFGSAFFRNPNITETPQLFVATPASYRLGPGDEITIDVWGASETRYEGMLSRQGVIKIDRLPPLYLSGLTLASAQRQIRKAFLNIYTGLASDAADPDKVFLDVNLKKARSIIINITGNVQAPGTYTLSGFSSVLNALYAAGGPDKNGSFRNIKIIRGGKVATNIDLYDYFVKGNYPNFFLNDQDVIVVAPYSNRIRMTGAFKNQGVFESLPNENMQDLLGFTGGFASNAYKEALYVDRINGLERTVLKLPSADFASSAPQDGDVVEAKAVSDKYTNRVLVSGEVYLPGSYPIEEAPTLSALLSLSSGPTPDAYLESALLYRTNLGVENELVSVDLEQILSETQDVNLQANDSLVVFPALSVVPERTVTIQGAVNKADTFMYYDGMTARDLVLLASGFQYRANTASIEVYRNQSHLNNTQKLTALAFSADETDKISLQPGDLMVVRLLEGYQPTEYVRVEGLSLNPGAYPIQSNSYSIYDLYMDSGGALDGANLSGVSINRVVADEDQEKLEQISDSAVIDIDDKKRLSIGVDLAEVVRKRGNHEDNIWLKADDIINIPAEEATVSLLGEVQRETVLPYRPGISVHNAIGRAGGFSQNAKRNRVYVVYQNGAVRATSNFLFLKFRPKLEPGAIVVVPPKTQRQKMSLQETISLTTAVASLTVLVRTLINN